MILLFDDTEKARQVINDLGDIIKKTLVVKENDYNFENEEYDFFAIQTLVSDCEKGDINLIILTDSVETLRHPSFKPVCIFCDGTGQWDKRSRDNDFVFTVDDRKDKIVNKILSIFS